jgi:hypothetical protein
MSEARRGPRVPQVNLFTQPPTGFTLPIPARYLEVVLIAFIVVVWAAVGAGIALLFGWHPSLGMGLGP